MRRSKNDAERGTSLLETLIAVGICTTVMFGLAAMISTATQQNKNMGSSMAQATTLAAQKLDQLMLLTFAYPQSGTGSTVSVDPGLTAGGSITTDTTGFVEYLDATGACLTGTDAYGNCNSGGSSSVGLFFTRRWQITDVNSGPTTQKRIDVLVTAKAIGSSSSASAPQATLSCIRVAQ